MRNSDKNANRSLITPHSQISDLDTPFTDEELVAIDAAFQSATNSTKNCRKLPNSFTPCSKTRFFNPDRPSTDEELLTKDAVLQSDNTVTTCRDFSISPASCRSIRSCRRLPHTINSLDLFSSSPYSRSRFYNLASPAKLTVRYPTLTFRGHISYSRTAHEVDEAAKELLQFVKAKKKDGRAVLGFDIEWKPTFRRGVPPGKAAVMQICGDTNRCYVMHIIHSGIPKTLQSLLEDDSTIKVGVCIANDGYKVFNDYSVSVKGLEDLSNLANHKLGGDPKKWSLALLAETIICKELPKPGKIRLGNWEAGVLSKDKLEYAASDAFASWYLYEALKSLPEANDNGTPVEDRGEINVDHHS